MALATDELVQVTGSVRGVYLTDVGQRVEAYLPGGLYRVETVGSLAGVAAAGLVRNTGGPRWWVPLTVAERLTRGW